MASCVPRAAPRASGGVPLTAQSSMIGVIIPPAKPNRLKGRRKPATPREKATSRRAMNRRAEERYRDFFTPQATNLSAKRKPSPLKPFETVTSSPPHGGSDPQRLHVARQYSHIYPEYEGVGYQSHVHVEQASKGLKTDPQIVAFFSPLLPEADKRGYDYEANQVDYRCHHEKEWKPP